MTVLVRRMIAGGPPRELECEGVLRIGRVPGSHIQLSDLMAAQQHAQLSPLTEFSLELECLSPIGVRVNGVLVTGKRRIIPGDEIAIGIHRLRLGVEPKSKRLRVDVRDVDESADLRSRARTSLAEAGWRLRRPAVVFMLLVLTFGLLIPLLLRPFDLPAPLANWIPGDQLWSSGKMSFAHQHFGAQCSNCHNGGFQRVSDDACLTCHAGIGPHSADDGVAMIVGLDEKSCTSCHLEHGGSHAIRPDHPKLCADCHADPGDLPGLERTTPATDFGGRHPQFQVRVSVWGDQGWSTQRVPLNADARDRSLLVFPHDLHLEAAGIRGVKGNEVLTCRSCHRADPADDHFQPLRYERDCQRCHQLDVDFNGEPIRLPHGDNATVRNLLEAAAGRRPQLEQAEDEIEERRRPGAQAERAVSERGSPVDDVFERMVCAKCHEVTRAEGQPAGVVRPRLLQSWMDAARFTHASHQWVQCDDCHAARQSAHADELLLPSLDSCRACHGGTGTLTQIPSTCVDCHGFHGDVARAAPSPPLPAGYPAHASPGPALSAPSENPQAVSEPGPAVTAPPTAEEAPVPDAP